MGNRRKRKARAPSGIAPVQFASQARRRPAGSVPGFTTSARKLYAVPKSETAIDIPASRNSHPMTFEGRRETRMTPMTGTATSTASLSRFENVQPAALSCDVEGRFMSCRFRNMRTTMPAKRTSESVPTDQAIRAAVFGFMLGEDSGRSKGQMKGGWT